MAFEFNGTNQWISVGSAPATAAPVTIAAHFYKTGTAAKNGIFLRASTTSAYIGFYFGSSNTVRGFLQDGGTQPDFAASGSYTINTWGHACLVCESSVLRTIYRNGGNSVQNTTSATPASLDRLDIAAANGATTFDGRFAEVGIWSAALDPDEVASLADGFTCDKVRPQSLVFYAPLIRNLQDIKGALTLIPNGGIGRVNLITYSEQFNNEIWTKTNATISVNVSTAPDGTNTADRITFNNVNSPFANTVKQNGPNISAIYTFSVYVKKGTQGNKISIFQDSSPYYGRYDFNLDAPSGNYTDIGNGWFRIWVTFPSSSIPNNMSIGSYSGGGNSNGDNVLIWGAQLEQNSSVSNYQHIVSSTEYQPVGDAISNHPRVY